jgi:cysteine-rich repeat protein
MRRLSFAACAAVLLGLAPVPARAAFHLWSIGEVFSNADGSIQYVEFTTASNSQHLVGAHNIITTSGGVTRTFTIPADLPHSRSGGRRFIVATPGFSRLPGGVVPDYTVPCGPFFDPTSATITINFMGADSLTFTAADLPEDGMRALVDTTPDAAVPTLGTAASSPQNYADMVGALTLSACLTAGTCDACEDGMFCNGAESCAGSACAPGTAPCTAFCDEGMDVCLACMTGSDCADGNLCTDDLCTAGACSNPPNTVPCDDGLFCTPTDACAGGACVGTGDACAGVGPCLEGVDMCGECTTAGDCDDGAFCTGVESCTAALCVAGMNPCDLTTTTCDEAADRCAPICGNGRLNAPEECDDGNAMDGDGCSAACAIEAGFDCDVAVEPSVCRPVHGPDAGAPDAGSIDGGSSDAGSSDAGSIDGGSSDAGSTDGGSSDAGSTSDSGGGPRDGGGGTDGGMVDSGTAGGESGGCGCSASSSGDVAIVAWLAVWLLRRRSRARR